MAVATTKKPAKTEVPASIQEVSAKRMSERIEAYRKAVADAVAGKVQTAEVLDVVVEHLDAMGLPDFAWGRDVEALRQMTQTREDIDTIEAGQSQRDERAAEINADIGRWTKQINEARAEFHTITRVVEIRYLDKMRRQRELELAHPQLFAPLNEAVQLRLDAKNGRVAAEEQVTGWST